MKKLAGIIIILFSIFTNLSYADDDAPNSVQQGAQQYDWQTCVETKTSDCINTTCATSDDPNCNDNCNQLSKDKCQSEGLNPQ